ncbi:Glutathionylspermidine synthase preATP-grasp [Selenomonas ruminantium]|uniref:Glutathionylspermidine synthase preATP-grasp n=1 Tax=Selenomonas ruminantium TaxID=971 RepID=A0A1I3C126_SELRU|nr:glutathionylspermidine synthase family protein [Selenomonas ruminantium]SFH68150.1 Glutathionylspermidine synthase preATP-grasp [Selenomonas ruminantium]
MAIANKMRDWIDAIDRNIMPFVDYEGYDYRYPADDIQILPCHKAEELRRVSQILFNVFQKAVKVCQHCDNEFLKNMEIPEAIIPYLHQKNVLNLPTWFSRFDYVVDRWGQFKMVEINADTPCAVVEAYYANRLACDNFGCRNPNAAEYTALTNWLANIYWRSAPAVDLHSGRVSDKRPFIFACFEDYTEDYGTTRFLMKAMKEGVGRLAPKDAIRFESFYTLRIDETNQIILPDGRAASAIYRLHPMEILIDETTADGESLGTDLMDGYKNSKFTMFNPPEAIIMQSKGFQALIWALAQKEADIFTAKELRTIKAYMLPSYFEEDAEKGIAENPDCLWIKKPLWGREGLGITVVDKNDTVQISRDDIDIDEIVRRDSRTVMWQKYVDQASIKVHTDEGHLEGYQTISCFMLGNSASALYSRFSPYEIAATEAYWLPLGI